MNFNTIKSILFGFAFSVGSTAIARIDGQVDRRFADWEFDRTLAAEGIVFCANDDHESSDGCELRFLESQSGRTINVRSQELRDTHCDGHKDLKVELSGSYTVKSIFGDYANIDGFEVLAQVPEGARTQKTPNQQQRNQLGFGRNI